MRYKPQSANPRYVGGVDKFDIYITRGGSIIAWYDNGFPDFVCLGSVPYVKGTVHDKIHWLGRDPCPVDIQDRIEAMIMCFAPDACAE